MAALFSVAAELAVDLLFPTFRTPITESIRMANYEDKIYDAAVQARNAWLQAGATVQLIERLIANNGDPDEISRLNLSVRAWEREAEAADEKALHYWEKLRKVAAYAKSRFGDLEASKRSLQRTEKVVAKVESLAEHAHKMVMKLQQDMGTFHL
jgi:hypothetical protein